MHCGITLNFLNLFWRNIYKKCIEVLISSLPNYVLEWNHGRIGPAWKRIKKHLFDILKVSQAARNPILETLRRCSLSAGRTWQSCALPQDTICESYIWMSHTALRPSLANFKMWCAAPWRKWDHKTLKRSEWEDWLGRALTNGILGHIASWWKEM